MKDKYHMIISIDVGKAFDKIYPFIKSLDRMGIQIMYLNIIRSIYSKLMANIKFNGEKLKEFSPKMSNKIRMLILTASIQYGTRNPS